MAYGDFKEVSHIAKFIKPSAHRGVLTKREWKKSQKSTQVDTRKQWKEKRAEGGGGVTAKNYRQYKKERVGTYKEYAGEVIGKKSKGRLAQLTSGWKNPFAKSTSYKQTGKKIKTGKTDYSGVNPDAGSEGGCLAGRCTP